MFTNRQQLLYFPRLSQDPATGEERYKLIGSPPCTLVGKDGVSTPTALPSGRGGGHDRHYAIHKAGPDLTYTSELGKSSPVAGSVESSRFAAKFPHDYSKTGLARTISIKLPQRLKPDYKSFASQECSVLARYWHRYRHPNRYNRYLGALKILDNHPNPNDKYLSGETEPDVLELGRGYHSTVDYPLIADESASTFLAMPTQDKKSHLQKGAKAVKRDISKVFGSSCSKAKSLFLRLTTRTELDPSGQPVRGTVRRRKGVYGIGSGDDQKVEVVGKGVVAGSVLPSHTPRPSLFTRLAKRIHPPITRNRLVKKRSGSMLESRLSLDRLSDDPEKMDPTMKNTIPNRSVMVGQSQQSSLRRLSLASDPPPPLPPYIPVSQDYIVRSTAPPRLDIKIPDLEDWGNLSVSESPKSLAGDVAESGVSWGGSTKMENSEDGSVSSVDGYRTLASRDAPGNGIERMERQGTGRSGGSAMSGTTAASRHSGLGSTYQRSQPYDDVSTDGTKTASSRVAERDTKFWLESVEGIDKKYQPPTLGMPCESANPSVPTWYGGKFPWEQAGSLDTQAIMA